MECSNVEPDEIADTRRYLPPFVRRGDYRAQFVVGEFGQRGDDRQQVGAHRFMRDGASLVAADPADSEGYNPADSEAGKGVHHEQLEIPG